MKGMKIIAFSDWRVQNINKLIKFINGLDFKPDVIVYSGDDILRFNKLPKRYLPKEFAESCRATKTNYFQKLAKLSKTGMLVIAGNDDHPFVKYAIRGENVFDIHDKPKIINKIAFLGQEGATKAPGFLLYSESKVKGHLNLILNRVSDRDVIIVSHAPPFHLLDSSVRFGKNRIGSTSLRKFIDKHHNRIRLIICGHSHLQGGKSITYKGIKIINCASHDKPGEPGKVAIVNLTSNSVKVFWEYIYKSEMSRKSFDLMRVPLIGYERARILYNNGIKSIKSLANANLNHELSKHPNFIGTFELAINYAQAILKNKPIVVGKHPFFDGIANKNIYFFDSEYDPEKTKRGKYGIFLLGWMDKKGKVTQSFLDNTKDEKKMLNKFRKWIKKEKPILVTYSSTNADKPHLANRFRKYGFSTDCLEDLFFDLYYDCIYTQRKKDQYIYLPKHISMGAKWISKYFGYKEPHLQIYDGLEALIEYKVYLNTRDKKRKKKIKSDLLKYNMSDLKRTRLIFEKLKNLLK